MPTPTAHECTERNHADNVETGVKINTYAMFMLQTDDICCLVGTSVQTDGL